MANHNIGTVVEVIREVEPLLRKANCIFTDEMGVQRFTNKFYVSYLGESTPNLKAYEKPVGLSTVKEAEEEKVQDNTVEYGRFKATIPATVAKLKSLYRESGYSGSYKGVGNQIEELGKKLYRDALMIVFKSYAPRQIKRNDGTKMTVGAYSNEGGAKFGHIVSAPTVNYGLLLLSIAYAYTGDRVGMSTCTMSTFIKEDRWISYYDTIVEMSENDDLDKIFPSLDKAGGDMGMELL